MKLPRFIHQTAALLGLVSTIVSQPLTADPAPNILLILVDDLGYQDLSCQGSPDIRTPQIDALAQSGLRFSAGYVTAPQCGPSRAGLLTGLNQARFGFLDNGHHQGIPPPHIVPTIADVLQRADYRTGMIGKWHVELPEYNRTRGPADRPLINLPRAHGFDSFVMIGGGLSDYFPYSPAGVKNMRGQGRESRLYEAQPNEKPHFIEDLPPDTYLTDYFSTRAIEYIETNRDQPWFLYLAYNAPHSPLMAPENDIAANSHIDNLPRRKFAGMMTALDRGVGRVIQALDDTGQRQKTLVFFISDNGGPTGKTTSRNDPLRGVKGDMFEGGIRVPFIASWPGTIPAGDICDAPVSTLDLLPTAAALAGQSIPAGAEGLNILPALRGDPSGLADRSLYWRWRGNYLAIRSGPLKETRNGGQGGGFYNIVDNLTEDDSRQLTDPVTRAHLADSLDRWNAQIERDAAALAW